MQVEENKQDEKQKDVVEIKDIKKAESSSSEEEEEDEDDLDKHLNQLEEDAMRE